MFEMIMFLMGFILVLTIFPAIKYSFIRAMISISLIWLFFILFHILWDRVDGAHLLMSMPVIIYWQYRYIKLGKKDMFKDRIKEKE